MVAPSLSLLGTREKGHHFYLRMLSVMFFCAVAVILFLLVVFLCLFDNIGRLLFVHFILVQRGHCTRYSGSLLRRGQPKVLYRYQQKVVCGNGSSCWRDRAVCTRFIYEYKPHLSSYALVVSS
jgi:hypothetical protein